MSAYRGDQPNYLLGTGTIYHPPFDPQSNRTSHEVCLCFDEIDPLLTVDSVLLQLPSHFTVRIGGRRPRILLLFVLAGWGTTFGTGKCIGTDNIQQWMGSGLQGAAFGW